VFGIAVTFQNNSPGWVPLMDDLFRRVAHASFRAAPALAVCMIETREVPNLFCDSHRKSGAAQFACRGPNPRWVEPVSFFSGEVFVEFIS
jgi:hypothetical protein